MDTNPSSIGPYDLIETLGLGGMGAVYRGRHRVSGHEAAVKTVRVVGPGQLAGLRREILALSRLGHPGVVRILDHGTQPDGTPWYAMELLEGATLAHLVPGARRAGDEPPAASPPRDEGTDLGGFSAPWGPWAAGPGGPAPPVLGRPGPAGPPAPAAARAAGPRAVAGGGGAGLRELLTVMRRVCETLAYLHGEGLVHRDLKPQNIVVEAGSGSPVLVDFGLASRFTAQLAREELDVAGTMAGTALYMAPEQLRGELCDARADLYALGCLLYELVAGRPPFTASSPYQLGPKHLFEQPAPPSTWVDGVAPELDELVLRLLAKEPRERLGYASDVAAALERLGAEDGASAASPKPRAYLYRPGLAGRGEALDELRGAVRSLKGRAGSVVLVGGESGVGKTRLAMEAAREARAAELLVLAGQCSPPTQTGAVALQAFRPALLALADGCRQGGVAETERLLGPRGKVLAPYEPALAGLPGQERHPEPAELPAEAARHRLYDALGRSLGALAERRPLLLVIDDLQWADELSLEALEHLARGSAGVRERLLVLGTYRSEEVGPGLQALLAQAGVRRLPLGRLDVAAVGEMVRDMLALDRTPERFVRFLARHSEGNPFFVAEYLRTALQLGVLWRDALGRWQVAEVGADAADEALYEMLPLPATVRELVGCRLDALDPDARRLAELAAVLGREVDPSVLGTMAGLGSAQGLAGVLDLLERHVLEETEHGQVRFVHDKIREVAYERLDHARRQALHRAAAETIERLRGGRRDEDLAALGHHWEQAQELGPARECYLAGARWAGARYATAQAERLYRAYLRLADEPTAEVVAARRDLARDVLILRGRNAEAQQELERAIDEARALGERAAEAAALVVLAEVLRMTARGGEARAACEQALALQRELGDRSAEATALRGLAAIDHEAGRLTEAAAGHEQVLAVYEELDDRRQQGITLGLLANVYSYQGALERAKASYQQALALHEEFGDRRRALSVLSSLGAVHGLQGQLERARAMLEQALKISRDIGDRRCEGVMLSNLASTCHDQGLLELATGLHEQGLAIVRELGDRRSEAIALSNLANVHSDLDRLEEARSVHEQALGLHRQLGDRRFEGVTMANLGGVRLAQGHFEAARELSEAALQLCREVGDRVFEAVALFYLGVLNAEQGHGQEARRKLEEALTLARSEGAVPVEAEALRELARLERRAGGDLQGAESWLQQAEALVQKLGNPVLLIQHLCERGHLELALGRPAQPSLDQAARVAAAADMAATSKAGKALDRLRRALDAHVRGDEIFRGEVREG
jgi:serine/threonine protein kinase/tetratricopeptide (TPR) repeat protein